MSISWFIVCLNVIWLAPWHECRDEKWMSIDLKITPEQPAIGEIVTLACDYDVRNEKLRGITFVKEGMPIYSYAAKNATQNTLYPINEDFQIIAIAKTTIQIQPLNQNASGLYYCEVWHGEPYVKSIISPKNMTVLPALEVVGRKEAQYKYIELNVEPPQPSIGDTVKITCDYNIETESVSAIKFHRGLQLIAQWPKIVDPTDLNNSLDLQTIGIKNNAIEFQAKSVDDGGVYSCTVICGHPSFEVMKIYKNVTVLPTPDVVEKAEPKSVELTIEPERASLGEAVNMTCNYNIGNERLIRLALFRGYDEILRYMPKGQEPTKIVSHLAGLKFIASENNCLQFLPLNVTSASSEYRCTVTTDGYPSQKMMSGSKYLTVLPATGQKQH